MKFDHLKIPQIGFIKVVIIGLLVYLIIPPYAVQAAPPPEGALSVSGNRIVNQNSDPVSFAGNSLFWSNDGWGGEKYYNASVVNWLKSDWKATIVRASMGVDESGGYISSPTSNKDKVTTVVDAAIAAGLYVIIDWHSHHAEDYQSEAISFFEEMATTYGSYDNVIYEIYNEPLQISWTNVIKPYSVAVISAIRAIDPDNLIIVGSSTWSQDVDIASQDPITGYSNIAYTLHFYAATHKQSLRDKATTALNNGIALMVTEWGTCDASGAGSVDVTSTNQWMDFLAANDISHCNWALNDKAETASALVPGASTTGGWTDSDLTQSGLLVKDIIVGWGPADINAPAAPTGLAATAGDATVSLNWNDNGEGDLAGYNVYRSTTSGSGYSKLNSSVVASSNYTDNTAGGGLTYYYVVTAVDASSNESEDSNEVSATPTDTVPPSAPTGLTAGANNHTVSLNWNNNTQGDLAGYNVYRSTTSGSGYVKVNTSLLSSSDYIDNSVNNGLTYYYVVTAVDTSSNESDDSAEVSATPEFRTDIEIIGSWTTGLSHTKETGTSRALIFIAHAEEAGAISLDSVTYGGQTMTRVIERVVSSGSPTVYYAYVAAYILNEAGVAAATSNTFTPVWSTSPDNFAYASVFLANASQASPIGATDSNALTTTTATITTAALSTSDGDMVVDAATCGNTSNYTVNNGFTTVPEQDMASSTGVVGYKAATGADETPSVTNSSVNRQVIIGFVVQGREWLYGDLTYDNKVNIEDLSEFCEFWWLADDCNETVELDLNDDCIIDFYEFSFFAQNWLVEI